MTKRLISKKVIATAVLFVIALTSIFVVSKVVSSPEFHAKTIHVLDEKKITVMELTAAAAGTSTALALIPSDATTPLANQILELSSYLLIVIGAIFLEKILLTLTCYITFNFLIPISCLSYGVYIYCKNDILKRLAIKLGVFGIAICMVVPVSVQVCNLIDATYQTSIQQTIEDAKNTQMMAQEEAAEKSEENSGWNELLSKVKDGISAIEDSISGWIEKGEKLLGDFIDAIATLLITSCVIPVVVLLFFAWLIKLIFRVRIPFSKANG